MYAVLGMRDKAWRVAFRHAAETNEGFANILVQATKLEVANGQAGTVLTYQTYFPVETECVKCGVKARVLLGIKEIGKNSVSFRSSLSSS